MDEPLHNTKSEALDWVRDNTDNALFADRVYDTVIRVDQSGYVYTLRVAEDGKFYWSSCREIM